MNKDNGNCLIADIRLLMIVFVCVCDIDLFNGKCFDFDVVDCYLIYRDLRPKLRDLKGKYKPKIER